MNPDEQPQAPVPTPEQEAVEADIKQRLREQQLKSLEVKEPKRASNTVWRAAEHEGPCHGEPTDDAKTFCNHDAHWFQLMPAKPKWRANYIGAPAFFNLNHACRLVNDAFGDMGFGCYLVGSSMHRRDFRDVDIRYIMQDEAFDRLFRIEAAQADTPLGGWLNPLWSLICSSVAAWLSAQSGLPVDFQIQRMTQANAAHSQKNGHPRSAMGIMFDYPGELPSTLKVEAPAPLTEEERHG